MPEAGHDRCPWQDRGRQWLGRCHGRLQWPAQPVRGGVQRSCLPACGLPLC